MEYCGYCGGTGRLSSYNHTEQRYDRICSVCNGTGRTPVQGPPTSSANPYPKIGDAFREMQANPDLWARWHRDEERTRRARDVAVATQRRLAAEARVMGTSNRADRRSTSISEQFVDYAEQAARKYYYENNSSLPEVRWKSIDPGQQSCTATAEVRIDRNGRKYYYPSSDEELYHANLDSLSEWDSSTHSYDPSFTLPPANGATMNSSTAIFLVTDKVRAIRVSYDTDERNNNPGYLFKTFDASIAKDDLVVVPTTTRHGFTICKVVEVDVDVDYTGGGIQYKWIAGKFDPSGYNQTLEQEQDIIDKVNRAERNRKRQELAAALKIDETEFGSNPLLLAGATTGTPPEQAS